MNSFPPMDCPMAWRNWAFGAFWTCGVRGAWSLSMAKWHVAFAARISEVGAELGVATVREFRGQGYAAAPGWSGLPILQSRKLFYSIDQTNISSRRVIARLGLHLLGASLRLS